MCSVAPGFRSSPPPGRRVALRAWRCPTQTACVSRRSRFVLVGQRPAVVAVAAGAVVVSRDGEHGDLRLLEPADLARYEAALCVARVRAVEEIARVEEEIGAPLDGGIHHALEAALEGLPPQ